MKQALFFLGIVLFASAVGAIAFVVHTNRAINSLTEEVRIPVAPMDDTEDAFVTAVGNALLEHLDREGEELAPIHDLHHRGPDNLEYAWDDPFVPESERTVVRLWLGERSGEKAGWDYFVEVRLTGNGYEIVRITQGK